MLFTDRIIIQKSVTLFNISKEILVFLKKFIIIKEENLDIKFFKIRLKTTLRNQKPL